MEGLGVSSRVPEADPRRDHFAEKVPETAAIDVRGAFHRMEPFPTFHEVLVTPASGEERANGPFGGGGVQGGLGVPRKFPFSGV